MLKSRLLLIVLALGFGWNSSAQTTTLHYTIGAAFFDIGTYTVTQKIDGDSSFYSAVSDVVVPYLFSKYKVQFITDSKFYNDTMILCHVDVIVNGKLRESNQTVYTGGNYKIHRVDEDENVRDEFLDVPAIFVTSSMLFFNEPYESEYYAQNYAELYGFFNKIVKSDKNSYDIIDKKTGRKTTYSYKKGAVVSTDIDYPLMTFGLTRVKD